MTEIELIKKFNSPEDIRDLIRINVDCARHSRILTDSERREVWRFVHLLRSLVE
jgi:hypothetical protein